MWRVLFMFLSAFALSAGTASAQDILGEVVSVQNVRLGKPEVFQMQAGEERAVRDVVVVTVELKSIKRFLPGALNPPDVLIGGVLAKPLLDPAITGQLSVIAPLTEGQVIDLLLVQDAVLPRKTEDGGSGVRLRRDLGGRSLARAEVRLSNRPAIELVDLATLRDRYIETKGRLQP